MHLTRQQLAAKIWASANKMRSTIPAAEYKDFMLGFIFYKYLSDKEIAFLIKNEYTEDLLPTVTEEDEEAVKWVRNNLGYFISYDNLFNSWIDKGSAFTISDVRDAFAAFDRLVDSAYSSVYKNIFRTLTLSLSKLGSSSGTQTKMVQELCQVVNEIPIDANHQYDTLGFVYEYLLSQFAATAGKKAGEFYTPDEVSRLKSAIVADHLKSRNTVEIYDPTSGSGSLLINIGKEMSRYVKNKDCIKYYAQELKEDTYNLTRMNLVMRGIEPGNIAVRNGDTLDVDWPSTDIYGPSASPKPLYVDAVVSNPPYSLHWDTFDKESDPRFSKYGIPPKSKADYAFLLHCLYHLKPDGIMTIVLPHGVLFRGGSEGDIRKTLIEKNHIDAVIGLPANIFYGTGIPTVILVLKQKKSDSNILFIDASNCFIKDGKQNKLRESDIKRIVDAVSARKDVENFAKLVSYEELCLNDFNLNIPRYVSAAKDEPPVDLYAAVCGGVPVKEIDSLGSYWSAFPNLKDSLFEFDGTPYAKKRTPNIKEAVKSSVDIKVFDRAYSDSFDDFPDAVRTKLAGCVESVKTVEAKELLHEELLQRIEKFPIIDKYEVYQTLSDNWEIISQDIEKIQEEGRNAIKCVEPNIVIKKKNGKDIEMQDGWAGHILPFNLVQKECLPSKLETVQKLEEALQNIPSEVAGVFEELTEEDKAVCGNAVNEDGTEFVLKEIPKKIKELKDDDSVAELLDKLRQVVNLRAEEKNLKKSIETEKKALEDETKKIIEEMTDETAEDFLVKKWSGMLLESLLKLSDKVANELASRVAGICDKYNDSIVDINNDIETNAEYFKKTAASLRGDVYSIKAIEVFSQNL